MSEQSPQPPAFASTKPWYMKWWVWLIAAALVIGGVSALINPDGDTMPSAAPEPTRSVPTEPAASETPSPSDTEVVYAENDTINRFIVAFNKVHPTEALTASDLTVYNHHGRDHEDQVQTQIGGADVVISEDNFSRGTYGVSVVWDNPTPGSADGNVATFRRLLAVVSPGLSDSEIDTRWQQLLDGPTVKWNDDTEATPGPLAANHAPGSFTYIKLYV